MLLELGILVCLDSFDGTAVQSVCLPGTLTPAWKSTLLKYAPINMQSIVLHIHHQQILLPQQARMEQLTCLILK